MRHLALAACAIVLAGCSFSLGGADTVTKSELEKQVASLYTPDDADADITADCAGELEAEADATQECHLTVGEEEADVRVVVTGVEDDVVDFEATPFVPADRVAETIKDNLAGPGLRGGVRRVRGRAAGRGRRHDDLHRHARRRCGHHRGGVTSVEGLMVNFDYKVVS